MNNLISIDFKRRIVIQGPSTESTARKIEPQTIFEQFDETIYKIEARFGDDIPKNGVIYKQSFRGLKFDSYGWGNCHNSIHQYKEKDLRKWNRPMPMPADLRLIDIFLGNHKGKTVQLGYKSDPFQWLDRKYSITKAVLELANKYKVKLKIFTMSDLCSYDDYLDLLKEGNHSIVFQMSFQELRFSDATERTERLVSPGAPSMKRRTMAIEKLKANGVQVSEQWFSMKDLNKKQRTHFEKISGTTIENWIEGSK